MKEKILHLPLDRDAVKNLKVEEIVYISGKFYTMRDEAHIRALEILQLGEKLPINIQNGAVFHCGPIVQQNGNSWSILAAGPTTSARMNSMEPEFIKRTGISVIIGKGGMNNETLVAMEEYGCVYLAMTGGVAILAAKSIHVKNGEWLDLGTPEALWTFESEKFGPLVVAMDANRGSIYAKVDTIVAENAKRIREKFKN